MSTFGCVVVSRNDGHGENLEERATVSLTSMINTFDEVIYVDWNSPTESLISVIGHKLPQKDNFKYIVITPDEARTFTKFKDDAQRVTEVLARNIGLRRLTTDYIVSTNIDIIVPTKEILQNYDWKDSTFYTVARRGIPLEDTRIKTRNDIISDMEKYASVGYSGAYIGDEWSIINCCGDFQLAHRDIWFAMKGFEESLVHRFYTDTNVQKKAKVLNYGLVALFDVPVFHIDHKGGKGERVNNPAVAIKDFTYTTNPDTWGFSDYDFKLRGLNDLEELSKELKDFYERNKAEKSDINEHLETIYNYVKTEEPETILELGVRSGKSTSALLSGIIGTKSRLFSCDINDPYGEIAKFIRLTDYWYFEKVDSVIFANSFNIAVNMIFIDTSHTFEHTLAELESIYPCLVQQALILMHDTHNLEYKDTYAAAKVFLDRHEDIIIEKEYINNNGLLVLRKL